MGHRIYIVGDPNNAAFNKEAHRLIAEYFSEFPTGKQRQSIIYYYPANWEMRIRELLPASTIRARVREEMLSERPSIDEFLKNSFGFVALHGNEVAGWCMSEYNTGDKCEVGIETAREHRNRGLATLTAEAMLRHAAETGFRNVGWHCWSDNSASIATAERLGLHFVEEYPVLRADAGLAEC